MQRLRLLMVWICLLTLLCACATFAPAQESGAPVATESRNVDIEQLVQLASAKLKRQYLYNPEELRGRTVTLSSPATMPDDEFELLLEAILFSKGLAVIEQGSCLRIAQFRDVRSAPAACVSSAAEVLHPHRLYSAAVPLANCNVNDAVRTLAQYLTQGIGAVNSINNRNEIVITDFGGVVQQCLTLLASLDEAPACLRLHAEFADAGQQPTGILHANTLTVQESSPAMAPITGPQEAASNRKQAAFDFNNRVTGFSCSVNVSASRVAAGKWAMDYRISCNDPVAGAFSKSGQAHLREGETASLPLGAGDDRQLVLRLTATLFAPETK